MDWFLDTLLEKYVLDGGPMMFVLLPCSLLMLGAILQGMIRLRRGRVIPRRLEKGAASTDPTERPAFIRGLADDPSPLARTVWLTLKDRLRQEPPAGHEDVQAELSLATSEVSDEMQDGLGLLGTIYTIAPLLGLMGTILGMMDAFFNFARTGGERSVASLSFGIQQALVTTLWGLGIAIPAFIAAQWMQAKIRRYERILLPRRAEQVIDSLYAGESADSPSGKPPSTSQAEV